MVSSSWRVLVLRSDSSLLLPNCSPLSQRNKFGWSGSGGLFLGSYNLLCVIYDVRGPGTHQKDILSNSAIPTDFIRAPTTVSTDIE